LRNDFPIVFGGDHSQGIGSINGLKNVFPEARVLWVDAHIDANTPLSTPSGNVHGCPVGYLSGLFPYVKKPVLSLKHLIYFGIRSWEPEEIQLVNDEKIPWFKSEDCLVERMDDIKA
jgi:arginase